MNKAEIVRDAIIAEFKRQAPNIYFWDPADEELFNGEDQEVVLEGGVLHGVIYDRFDMDAIAMAAMKAMGL